MSTQNRRRPAELPADWRDALDQLQAPPCDYFILRRNGLPLCGLPSQAEAFDRTLALYRPQRWAGRIAVRVAGFLGPHRRLGMFLAKAPYSGAPGRSASGPVGLLGGNPSHARQRILFCRPSSPGYEFGKMSKDAGLLRHEAEILRCPTIPRSTLPGLIGLEMCGPWTVLRTQYLDSVRHEATLEDMVALLGQWILPGSPRKILEFPFGKNLPGLPKVWAESVSKIFLRPSVFHGDFATWNILRLRNGNQVAVDWEEGCPEDAPGLDLVHALLQRELLVRRTPAPSGLRAMERTLASAACRSYLETVGWGQHAKLLLGLALWREASLRAEVRTWLNGISWDSFRI